MFEIVAYSARGRVAGRGPDTAFLDRLEAGDRLAVVLPNGYELAVVLLECFKRGIVCVPVQPNLPQAQIDFIISHSEAAAKVVPDGRALRFTRLNRGARKSPAGDRFLIYTSGSTGFPKGVVLTDSAVRANAEAVAALHEFGRRGAHATCLPLFHCNALMMSLLGCYLSNTKLVLCSRFEPAQYFAAVREESVDTASIVPALLHRLVEAEPAWPASLRYLITAAAPLTGVLARRFFDLYGPHLVQGYGLTEAVNFSFVMPPMDGDGFRRHYLAANPPVGKPLPGTRFRIEGGEVQVKGPNTMRGYWRNPESTASVLTEDGWLKTGDLGELHDELLVLKGRIKEVINRGGESFYPAALEETFERAGLARPFAALAVENERLGDDIGCHVATNDIDTVFAAVEACQYKPGAVQTGSLSLSSTGKVRRGQMGRALFSVNAAPERYGKLLAATRHALEGIVAPGAAPPANEAARYIVAKAREVLQSAHAPAGGPDRDHRIFRVLNRLTACWPQIARAEGPQPGRIACIDGLMGEIWREWPMVDFAEMVGKFLAKRGPHEGHILELTGPGGSCIGTIRESARCSGLASAPSLDGAASCDIGGFEEQAGSSKDWPAYDAIIGVNCLHLAADKSRTLAAIHERLRPGGALVLAEGVPVTNVSGAQWCLAPVFGLIPEWRMHGGFLPRRAWIEMLHDGGFCDWGYATLRAGAHDLGGLIWALVK